MPWWFDLIDLMDTAIINKQWLNESVNLNQRRSLFIVCLTCCQLPVCSCVAALLCCWSPTSEVARKQRQSFCRNISECGWRRLGSLDSNSTTSVLQPTRNTEFCFPSSIVMLEFFSQLWSLSIILSSLLLMFSHIRGSSINGSLSTRCQSFGSFPSLHHLPLTAPPAYSLLCQVISSV